MQDKRGKRGVNHEAKQEQAILALVETGGNVRAAAAKIGVDESTLFRWLQDETFSARLSELRKEIWEDSISRLQGGWSKALDTLAACMDSAKDSDRIRAAALWCDIHFKAQNAHALEERIKQLEEQLSKVLNILDGNTTESEGSTTA